MTPGNFEQFLPRLSAAGVDYILIGGGAAIVHGLARATYDVDIVYERSDQNLRRLSRALIDLNPYYRGAPPGLPFKLNEMLLRAGLNFTFTSDWGDIDLLGEVAGGGTYDSLQASSETFGFYGQNVRVVTLNKLIDLKRAAGRPKDFETIAELELLQEERGS